MAGRRLWSKIYDLFLSGKTINEIAATLTSMGVLTPAGRTKWSVSTVRSILSNEKYKGEALLQKTFTVDYLTKEVRRNNGEVPSVRVRNSHEPIIEPEVFDRVQSMLATSAKRRAKVVWRLRSTGEHYNVWYCNHKYDGDKTCDSPRLRDEEVKAAFEKMLQKCGDPNPVYTDERWNKLVESVKGLPGRPPDLHLNGGQGCEGYALEALITSRLTMLIRRKITSKTIDSHRYHSVITIINA